MSLLTAIIVALLAVILLFVIVVLACSFALGRMHVWLKDKAEVFGDNDGIRAEIRTSIITRHNDEILNRNNSIPR